MMPTKEELDLLEEGQPQPTGGGAPQEPQQSLSAQVLAHLVKAAQDPPVMPPAPRDMSISEALAFATLGTMYKSKMSQDLLQGYVLPELQWRESYPDRLAAARRDAQKQHVSNLATIYSVASSSEREARALQERHEYASRMSEMLPTYSQGIRDLLIGGAETFGKAGVPQENIDALLSDLDAYDSLVSQIQTLNKSGKTVPPGMIENALDRADALANGRDELLKVRNDLFLQNMENEARLSLEGGKLMGESIEQIDRANLLIGRLNEYVPAAETLAKDLEADDPNMAAFLDSSVKQARSSAELVSENQRASDPVNDELASSVNRLESAVQSAARRKAQIEQQKQRAAAKQKIPSVLLGKLNDKAAGLAGVRKLKTAFYNADDPASLVGPIDSKSEAGMKFQAEYTRVAAPIRTALMGAAQTEIEMERNVALLPTGKEWWRPAATMKNAINEIESLLADDLIRSLQNIQAAGYDAVGVMRNILPDLSDSDKAFLMDWAAQRGIVLEGPDIGPPPGISVPYTLDGMDSYYNPDTGEVFVRESP